MTVFGAINEGDVAVSERNQLGCHQNSDFSIVEIDEGILWLGAVTAMSDEGDL